MSLYEDEKDNIWRKRDDYPEEHRDIIVMDSHGYEFDCHQWNGHAYYWNTSSDENGWCDGYPSFVDIVRWKYADET